MPMGNERLRAEEQLQLRLIVTIPATICLFVLAYGLISYHALSRVWGQLVGAGNTDVANELMNHHLIALLVLTVLGALIGAMLAVSILRPIRGIVETAKQVASGSLDTHVPLMPAARELGDLSASFNHMIDDLKMSIEERDRLLLEGVPSAVVTLSPEGRLEKINRAGSELLGIDQTALVGTLIETVSVREGLKPVIEYLQAAVADPLVFENREVELEPDASGMQLRATISVLRDARQQTIGILAYIREADPIIDLSEHLYRTDQLAALGTFSLGLAHQLRNPIGSVKGLGQLLIGSKGLNERQQEYLNRMIEQIDRVDALVAELLDLTSEPVAAMMTTDLGKALVEADRLARQHVSREHRHSIEVLREIEENLPPLRLERDRIVQALAKIIQNAYEATPEGGTITLRANLENGAGNSAPVISVHNTGSTLEAAMVEKIFDPFFSTNTRARGLGLTVANHIIVQNGGKIEVLLEADAVCFRVCFDSRANAIMKFADGTGKDGDQ